jgi:hypothetical protein
MSPGDRRARAIQLLREDPLRHIVSLKMLTRLHEQVELCLVEAEHGWALLLSFPSDVLEYDAKVYGIGLVEFLRIEHLTVGPRSSRLYTAPT